MNGTAKVILGRIKFKNPPLPETGSQGSEWLIATGLMAALTAYGLSKKKD